MTINKNQPKTVTINLGPLGGLVVGIFFIFLMFGAFSLLALGAVCFLGLWLFAAIADAIDKKFFAPKRRAKLNLQRALRRAS